MCVLECWELGGVCVFWDGVKCVDEFFYVNEVFEEVSHIAPDLPGVSGEDLQ